MAMIPSSEAAPRPSQRALNLEPPYIENVLDKYSSIAGTTNFALGLSHWGPPPNALKAIKHLIAQG